MKPMIGSRDLLKAVVVASTLIGAACAPTNPDLGAPAELLSASETSAPVQVQAKVQPKVDILFVIDTSNSMGEEIQNLYDNVDKFVDAFDVSNGLDFQIGVTSVYDSRRYGVVVPVPHPLGKLRPVKGPDAGAPFITRTETFRESLRETLKLEIEKRFGETTFNQTTKSHETEDLGGPEYEELFTPIMAAPEANPGFIRQEAHLAVIIVSDASDQSLKQATEVDAFLSSLKGGDRKLYSVHAALILSPNLDENDPKACIPDQNNIPGEKPQALDKIEQLVKLTDGEMFDLCQYNSSGEKNPEFGVSLAEIGKKIKEKASERIRIALNVIPDPTTLKVSVGGQVLEPSQEEGFTYKRGFLYLNGQPYKGDDPNAMLSIEYVPLAAGKVSNGRVIPIGQ